MNDLIAVTSAQLRARYPEVHFEVVTEDEMVIKPTDENGFTIAIQQGERENTIHFDAWHFHFDKDEAGKNELTTYLGYGMSEAGRLKTYSRNGAVYKWVFEIFDEQEKAWQPAGTMALFNFRFWEKPVIGYRQNKLIVFPEA
jgi:hypothetical protein